ncbi:Glutathione S-transferase S1 [Gryllus bimaculatus]|nr:Glutathione S-transferase S1 [Gryllus bimaculatus]
MYHINEDNCPSCILLCIVLFAQYNWRTPEAEKPAKADVLKKENIPTYLSQFEKILKENNALGMYHWRTPEAEKPARAEVLKTENISPYLSQFQKILEENDGHFVNGKLSYADLFFAGTVECLNNIMKFDVTEGYPLVQALLSYADLLFAGTAEYFNNVMKFDVFEGYPLAKALVEKVHNLPRIKEWVARRPQTLL